MTNLLTEGSQISLDWYAVVCVITELFSFDVDLSDLDIVREPWRLAEVEHPVEPCAQKHNKIGTFENS